eukprot:FR735521.1.p3 GENE.FR735521.1~~FR735521.1.p3  ORF type:complete len:116 (+),score=12.49 FR735521.1:248-595(+)
MFGVAYRSAFFDFKRLTDYGRHPGAGFFVDDDWIAAALDHAGIARVVLGMDTVAATATSLFELPVVNEHVSKLASLNGHGHAFRNIGFQETSLTSFKGEGLFDSGRRVAVTEVPS